MGRSVGGSEVLIFVDGVRVVSEPRLLLRTRLVVAEFRHHGRPPVVVLIALWVDGATLWPRLVS
jgi:hypothetical protein